MNAVVVKFVPTILKMSSKIWNILTNMLTLLIWAQEIQQEGEKIIDRLLKTLRTQRLRDKSQTKHWEL